MCGRAVSASKTFQYGRADLTESAYDLLPPMTFAFGEDDDAGVEHAFVSSNLTGE
jgi:hypothetical protein